jgi:cbb3-type cytochrome oxidase subunit 3
MRTGFQGATGLLLALALFVVLALAIRSFFVIVIAAAFAAVVILHFWNKRPVKTPEDDQVRLHLNDDADDKLAPK